MKMIGTEEILIFHKKIIKQTGGLYGVRDIGLIESALNRASVTFDGIELYKSIEDKISVITYGLIKNHGFVDGNKRIGVSTMLLLLRINDIQIHYTQNELVQLGLGIADGSLDEKEINKWIKNHIL
ncbi:MAG: type II toxin-antitoxin system death-on-curing family toxin [Clostridiales bacterium]|nr:type II toxin-antitoxin system death-on-curing family toxin [Clostridiales bacterium]